MNDPFAHLAPPQVARYEEVILRFEEAWEKGTPPDIAGFWKVSDDPALLAELVRVDLERRRQAGQAGSEDAYLKRFPQLAQYRSMFPAPAKNNDAAAGLIVFACPSCGKEYRLKAEFAGRSTRCSGCQGPLLVPNVETVALRATGVATRPPPPPVMPPSVNATRPPAADANATLAGDVSAGLKMYTLAQAGLVGGVTLDWASDPTQGRRPIRDILAGKTPDAGRYIVENEIARGGMGAVLRAVDSDIRREVAVKYLLDQSDHQNLLRFVEEAQITGQLEHPNIVPIHELGIDTDKRVFFAMKLVKGRSLAEVLASLLGEPAYWEKEFSLNRLLNIFVNVCNALAYAHARGVIHRDLKPANIMTGDFGEVYVMDWGLAKVLRGTPGPARSVDDSRNPWANITKETPAPPRTGAQFSANKVVTNREREIDMTQEGSVVGTPVYMPPEQATGQIHAIDERSDVYSLGAILYQMLTLQPPINREGGYPEVLKRVAQGDIVAPALCSPERARAGKIPKEMAAIAMKALAWAPKDRYQNATDLRRDVERFMEGRSVSAKEDTKTEMLVKFVKRNKGFSATTAAALVVLAVVVGLFLSINLKARREVESAYSKYETEQKEKEARTRQAVPALVKVAKQEAARRDVAEALKQVNLALEYDSNNADALLLHGQLMLVKQDFRAAAQSLGDYAKHRAKDRLTSDLRRLCEKTPADDEEAKGNLVQMAQILTFQDYPMLAEELLTRHGKSGDAVRAELLTLYQDRLRKAWPKEERVTLSLDESGYHLKIVSDNVRTLEPLKGIPLRSVQLECRELSELVGLEGIALKSLYIKEGKITNLAGLEGMALTSVDLESCFRLSDISALKDMPLSSFVIQKGSGVRELTALRGMPLRKLHLQGCGGLTDLTGLEGLTIENLEIENCGAVNDLTPLANMPLTALTLKGCVGIQSLTPLRGMPLLTLDLSGCAQVRDLTPLQGMALNKLDLSGCTLLTKLDGLRGLNLTELKLGRCTGITDLTPLRDMPLLKLELDGTGVVTLAPLRDLPLKSLTLAGCTSLTDLSALKGKVFTKLSLRGCVALKNLAGLEGMRLNMLDLTGCVELANINALEGMPLNVIHLDGCTKVESLAPLRTAILTQLTLDKCAAIQDLQGLETIRFPSLTLSDCKSLTSLAGLKGGSLRTLNIVNCGELRSLKGLAGSSSTNLSVKDCPKLSDISDLKELPVTSLSFVGCDEVRDVSALEGMKLVDVRLPVKVEKGLDVLRKMPSLVQINGISAAGFWRAQDASEPKSK